MKLKEKLKEKIETERERVNRLLKEHGDVKVGDITIAQVIGGMRGLKVLVTDISYLDPFEGIRYRGYTVDEVLQKLPKPKGAEMPYDEAQFYLLMTGDIPTEQEVQEIIDLFKEKRKVPNYVYKVLDSMPTQARPDVMLAVAVDTMQQESVFAKAYAENKITKQNAWEYMLEDVLNLLPKIPMIAAYIYRLKYKNNNQIPENPDLDFGGNFAHMMGIDKPYDDFSRLYFILLSDHESGNVSAHTTHLVASAWADAYYSLAAGINGLSGPLHGGATQEALKWFQELLKKLNKIPTKEELEQFCWDTLNSGQVIPGYGHAVLRKTDPRFVAQLEFGKKHLPDDKLFQLVSLLYEVAPDVLTKHGKAKNPWPNCDNITGTIQAHYGVDQYEFYPVLFDISRSMGVLSNITWDRALGYPIERPKSVTLKMLESLVQKDTTAKVWF
ncbi:MAG: citrate (Si)-synthase [Desulfurella sp.]|uniref:citrate synthase (unknown stereospecificity) n=1 Tax=Desulfurella multipotens TaxID=79269 RepID=A0A1G6N8W3_9BACT|nr:citrate (Si)-synthase [Desulfurella multipotens]SDC63585.1 citrate synthase [Desulfurella multipotens]